MNSDSFYLSAMLTYIGVGIAFDIALFVIILSSDKSAYGIGEPKSNTPVNEHSVDDFDVF